MQKFSKPETITVTDFELFDTPLCLHIFWDIFLFCTDCLLHVYFLFNFLSLLIKREMVNKIIFYLFIRNNNTCISVYEKWAAALTKSPVCPAKTQISLGICPVWSVLAVRMKKPWVFSFLLSAQWRRWSDWADANADLSSLGTHNLLVLLSGGSNDTPTISNVQSFSRERTKVGETFKMFKTSTSLRDWNSILMLCTCKYNATSD